MFGFGFSGFWSFGLFDGFWLIGCLLWVLLVWFGAWVFGLVDCCLIVVGFDFLFECLDLVLMIGFGFLVLAFAIGLL